MEKDFLLSSYDFYLPKELIAQYPLKKRSESRLLVVDRSKKIFFESKFKQLPDFVPENSLLVFNQSKVIPARIFGRKKSTNAKIEFLLLTPLPLIQKKSQGQWSYSVVYGLLRPLKRLRQGDIVVFSDDFYLRVKQKFQFGRCEVELFWRSRLVDHLNRLGTMPLPPYIKRGADVHDFVRYQTVFAREEKAGSVAAPTAGLHFDEDIIRQLEEKGVEIAFITLYVGAGTFEPVRCQDIRQHRMHEEYVEIDLKTTKKINLAKKENRPVIAVGTTTVRTLEGVYKKLHNLKEYKGWVDLYIYPGFKFNIIDHMITNFHLPRSSLLLLVSAFAGRKFIISAYNFAVKNKFRFFSYGDCMLIL
ncbi:tRNA preQ1(34) S-adenosylmethionine ribosyltransferase-isomerase QueA [Desulfothermus okinawensis JCM 13304]